MTTYQTLDFLKDLTPAEMSTAIPLTLTTNISSSLLTWYSKGVLYSTTATYASLSDLFSFQGEQGVSYDLMSSSFFDPFIMLVYDHLGNAIESDNGRGSYGYDHITFTAPYSGTFYVDASWYQGSSSSNKFASLSIYQTKAAVIEPVKNVITGTATNDWLLSTHMDDVVNGGSGIDTFVYGRQRDHYSVVNSGGTLTVYDYEHPESKDVITNVERLKFFDMYISYETSGVTAEAYRLYQAAFGRTPDKGGLGYWIGQMGNGESLKNVAASFASSAEFKTLYGAAPSNEDILRAFYKNVLDRTPDEAGYNYWVTLLNNKSITVADMLLSFSESAENQAQVVGSLQSGYEFSV